jgi:AraC-like DNA-binding protein
MGWYIRDMEVISPSLLRILDEGLAAAGEPPRAAEESKNDVLLRVQTGRGWAGILQLGKTIAAVRPHPVIDAILAAADPVGVAKRWQRVERFGHVRHRTQILDVGQEHIVLRHIAEQGQPPTRAESVFACGMFAGLLSAYGCNELVVSLGQPSELVFARDRPERDEAWSGADASVWTYRFRTPAPIAWFSPSAEPSRPSLGYGAELASLVGGHPAAGWSVARAADRMGLSVRGLQRRLATEGTSFRATVTEARLRAAAALLSCGELGLAEIAFACGFADHAHFARCFRRCYEVPPSGFREAIATGATRQERRIPWI